MNKNELLPAIICAQESVLESGGVINDYLTDASCLAYQCNCIVFTVENGNQEQYHLNFLYAVEHICLNAATYKLKEESICTFGSYRAAKSVLRASYI